MEYDSGKTPEEFGNFIYDCYHEPKRWLLKIGYKIEEGKASDDGRFTLEINFTNFDDLPEAPERERAPLARSKVVYKMDGPTK